MNAIEMIDVDKSYGPVAVLQGIDLHIVPDNLVAFSAPSGAGKATIIPFFAISRPSARNSDEIRVAVPMA
ncbi:MAG: hypothetical protein GFH27_549307n21 [Chloroflexi bacterium AL-W]|nr:hypothetical protein [Chloroflexi bacterium AL-N1]NOK69053.1 hypothetical protein [Chloroflexi bacterium AL-N10]NOK77036.1 hypothetical protein [Chloroflexi bacterium AL-N5]NOK83681.1 hypothetical protein [Chloroflexi bacterium AL-W]NOK90891.1 hypothetical protein [Chloroflexi bacterium AL-N15]